ncbi:MAG: hypothetical protein IPK19_41590 [Chloroflexi bacterium]|nr:hypothetical protein [Chloroflexota bacterium]
MKPLRKIGKGDYDDEQSGGLRLAADHPILFATSASRRRAPPMFMFTYESFPILETPRLILREISFTDARHLLVIRGITA